ncbi:MAG: membrane protein insertase YidC, partial [Pseudomonadota bacterium]
MDDNTRNLILATALSFLVMLVWFVIFPPEPPQPALESAPIAVDGTTPPQADPTAGADASATTAAEPTAVDAPRIALETDRVTGSVSLQGGRIDDLALKDYRTEALGSAPIVDLLRPLGTDGAYYALFGWAPGGNVDANAVPGADTLWTVSEGRTLSVGEPITLSWSNGAGLSFSRQISIDEDFLFTITQSVRNDSGAEVSLAPYGTLARHGQPDDLKNFFILHEGLVRMSDGVLDEIDYDNIGDVSTEEENDSGAVQYRLAESGWIGFTDHYWMATLAPADAAGTRTRAQFNPRSDIYQSSVISPTQSVAPGATASVTTFLFAGAKEWETIRNYEAGERIKDLGGSIAYALAGQEAGIAGFLDSIDWGWFFFLTKPIFFVLHELNVIIGNMGWSIIG